VARAVVNLLKQSAATDIIEFAEGRIVLIGIQLDENSEIIDKSLSDVGLIYKKLPFRTVAIKRRQRTIIPKGSDIFMEGDQVYVITEKKSLPEFVRLTGKSNVKMENVMILGGGQIGIEIANQLEKMVNVKVIESDKDKSFLVADMLRKSLVIRGDGRDFDLLAREGIIDMDAFISATGDDETNILSCLMAKHLKVSRIISLINKTDYIPIIPTIGIDAYVSRQMITVDKILKFIWRGSIVSVASLPGIAAEAIEYIAKDQSRIIRKKLRDMNFPKGAIVGAVLRGDEVFVPTGNAQIQAGDEVIIFALPASIRDVEKLFE
jgi:trk system potassium uptake protein TrkA